MNVLQGGTLIGIGTVCGNIHNAGLVKIPITALGQVYGGHGVISVPTPIPGPGGSTPQPPIIVAPAAEILHQGTIASIGGSSVGAGSSGSAGGGGRITGPSAPVITYDTPIIPVQGTFAVDASLEVTGSYTQTNTGALRLLVDGNQGADFNVSRTGGTYSQLFVDQAVTLAGTLQIVLQPEFFNDFSYTPHIGDTFDFVTGLLGINLDDGLIFDIFVDEAGASLLNWLTLTPFNSGIASDPDKLYLISEHLFSFSLVDNKTVLRGTLTSWGPDPASQVPLPSTLWLVGAGLLGFARFNRRRKDFVK